MDQESFKAADYVVLAVVLISSSFIGMYFGWKDRKDSSTHNYFYGKQSLNPVALSFSIIATTFSAITFVSEPAEVYITGDLRIWNSLATFIACIPAIVYIVPAFRRLGLKSIYQFLELRFSKTLKRICSITGIIVALVYSAILVYLSSVTLTVVTSISVSWGILICSAVCVFYTSLGGMKAVVWTDALQFVFMLIGLFAIIISGLKCIGGFDNLLSSIDKGERHNVFRFDYGVVTRVSPFGVLVGGIGQMANRQSFVQQLVQRYQSYKTTSQAQWAVLLSSIVGSFIYAAITCVGLIIYSIFSSCDPQLSGEISSIDQVTSYGAMRIFNNNPGMAGLYIATIFCAALSTVSSVLNSFTMVVIEDVLCIFWRKLRKSDVLKVIVGKLLVVAFGVLVTAMAFITSFSESNAAKLVYSLFGVLNGPICGLYILGFFFPRANCKGGTVGFVLSLSFGLFVFIGNEFFKVPYQADIPPRYTYGCLMENSTVQTPITAIHETTSPASTERSVLQDIFNLNYTVFFIIEAVSTVVTGYLVSLATGPNDPGKCDPKLFIPLVDNKHLPPSVRKFFRFGVPEIEVKEFTHEQYVSNIIIEDNL